jgi:tetratricopeptide (TPR) repeat protein
MRSVSAGLVCIFVASAVGTASAAQSTARIVTRPDGAVQRATEWVEAILTHAPGKPDDAVSLVVGWTTTQVTELLIELSAIRRLMRDPHTKAFPLPIEFDRTRGASTEIQYSTDERSSLDAAATRLSRRGLTDVDFVMRGIVLHSDIAQLGDGTGTILRFWDGGRMDLDRRNADHWQMARALVDRIDAKAGRGSDLAFWYRATLSTMASSQIWNAEHADHALKRFADDAELQFLAGCLHETLAAAQTQVSLANTKLPAGVVVHVRSSGNELQQASSLLKRALELNPGQTEARLHFGRVLTLTGHAAAAVTELQRAIAGITDPAQQYYAQLFLGAALEAADQRAAAARAYQAAATLFPRAQAPRLALSQLALSTGDRAGASAAIEPLLTLSAREDERADPWWNYFGSYGHGADELMAQARQRLVTPSGGSR